MSATAFPLAWPQGWPRISAQEQRSGATFKQAGGQFGLTGVTLEVARKKLFRELDMMAVANVVLSTNVPLRSDGQPRSDAARYRIDDPGVALYFTLRGKPMAMACDRYDTVAANCRSLGLAIEAMRQLERHGGGTMMERAFTGFAAIAAPRPWWDILECRQDAPLDVIEANFRRLCKDRHPDHGGSDAAMAELNGARDLARKARAAA